MTKDYLTCKSFWTKPVLAVFTLKEIYTCWLYAFSSISWTRPLLSHHIVENLRLWKISTYRPAHSFHRCQSCALTSKPVSNTYHVLQITQVVWILKLYSSVQCNLQFWLQKTAATWIVVIRILPNSAYFIKLDKFPWSWLHFTSILASNNEQLQQYRFPWLDQH